jgi:hypothetical protein
MKILCVVSIVLFVVACCVPALEFTKSGTKDILSGGNVLGVGWSGIFAGVFAWYANPIWLLALIMGLIGKPKIAAIAGIAALLIGLTTFTLFGESLPADVGGTNQMMMTRTLVGCYILLASLASMPALFFFKDK